MSLNLQHLRHFVAVAEELNFRRASEKLGMAQPPLSQSVQRLEANLGCRLFVRSRRKVELTAAGEALIEHAREILDQVECGRRAVARAVETGFAEIRIGVTPNALSDAVPRAMRAIKKMAPTARLTLVEATAAEQMDLLLRADLDIGFFVAPVTIDKRLDTRVVARNALVLAIPSDLPLAANPEPRLEDLADVPLLTFPQARSPVLYGALMEAFRAAGVSPRIEQEATYDMTRLKLTAAGLGVSIVNEAAAPLGFPGVTFRRIADLPDHIRTDLVLCWRRTTVAAARKLAQTAFKGATEDAAAADA